MKLRWLIRTYKELPEYGPALKTTYARPVLQWLEEDQFAEVAEWHDIPTVIQEPE